MTDDLPDLASLFPGLSVPRPREAIGRVVATPGVLGGAARLDGTRIPTALVWEYRQDGGELDEILQAYPSLTPEDVHAALEHEARLRARSA